MSRVRRKFDKEFKLQAVKMVLNDGLSKAEAGRKLGVSQSAITKWVEEFRADGVVAFPGNGKLKPHEEELRKLRQENKELRMETDFLKKAPYTLPA